MDNAERLTWQKNEDYRGAFRHVIWIANIEAVVILALSIALFLYVNGGGRQDSYFAQTQDGRQMEMISLHRPNLETNALSNWVSQAAVQVMTFGFNDVDQRFEKSYHNFTPAGWDSFYKAMISSKIIEQVIKTQQLVTAVPVGPPVLMQEGLFQGKYTWVFDMQLLITFRSGGAQKVSRKSLRVVLEPVPTADNPNGVGIGEWMLY